MRTHNKKTLKRPSGETEPPAAKRAAQSLLPGASAVPLPAAAPKMAAGKSKALLKGIVSSVKAAAKAKATKWHQGDHETVTGSAVMDEADFSSLLKGIPLASSGGVLTTFSLSAEQLSDLFGGLLDGVKVPTWSHARSFQKAYRTGDAVLDFRAAEGKYSRGTSTLTLKMSVRAGAGGGGCEDYDGGSFGWMM